MIRIYERSRLQSYRGAFRQGILVCEAETEAEAAEIVEDMTCDSYVVFAVLPDGTVIDAFDRHPQHLAEEMRAEAVARWRKVIEGHEARQEHSEANRARMALHRELREIEGGR